jgi:Fur family ferric uptake transcriptional regulator
MVTPGDRDDLLAAEGIFQEYLRDHGLKYTRERRAVLHGVMSNEHHFEAEQLLIDLRAGGQRVAKATIYRTLPLLVDCGLIKQVQFGDKGTRYEHTYGHQPHDHMVCKRCGRIIEFDSSEVARLATSLADAQRFQAMSHRFQIVGLCADCQKAPPSPGESRADGVHSPASEA